MVRSVRRAFTLVEILIVVVVLGILAALVVPLFTSATRDAEAGAAVESLGRARRAVLIYYVRNGNSAPSIPQGSGLVAWGGMITEEHLKEPPFNPWVSSDPVIATAVVPGSGPDPAWHQNYGWIYQASGPQGPQLWAAGFDAQDQPLPRP